MAKKRATRARRAKKAVKKAAAKKSASRSSRSKPAAGKGGAKKRAAKKGAARKRSARRPAAAKRAAKKKAGRSSSDELLTLTEVAKRTGISMPTLQRYKKEYQDRLQTVGKGRTQRYKAASLATFKEIKKENLKKRGRPRKDASAKPAKRAARGKSTPGGLISLSEIGRRTGISYPTLLRYVRLHGDQIPSHGTGRKRRFPVSAVPVFSRLRKESRRGRRKGSPAGKKAGGGLEARLRRLEKSQAGLERQIRKLVKALKRPLVKGL